MYYRSVEVAAKCSIIFCVVFWQFFLTSVCSFLVNINLLSLSAHYIYLFNSIEISLSQKTYTIPIAVLKFNQNV